jgi:CHAT domain-containing protein
MHLVLAPDRLATLVRRPDGVAQASVRRVDRSEVQRAIGALRRALVTRGAAEVPAAALHALLLADAEPALAAARGAPLVLSLTGALRYVPFAALHDGRGWLVERHAVRMLAGASGASGASAAAPRGTGRGAPPPVPTAARIAGLGATRAHEGFPALPGVRAELEAIVRTTASPAGLLPGEIHLDEAFGAAALRQAVAGGFGFVHVASHFEFDPDDGRPSVLLLGDGTLLPLPRLAELDFRGVEQLTLSACDTASAGLGGTGAGPGGAEFEGLAALVQQRGARAVLATLWPVADASTVRLMQAYYGARGAGREGAEALRSAQLALLRGEGAAGRHAHPYFWAPFVLSTAGR